MSIYNVNQHRKIIKNFNKGFEGNEGYKIMRKQWEANTIKNLPLLKKENSIWRLQDKHDKGNPKAFILVGSSPSLERDVHALKGISDNFRILCSNSSLKYLLKHGVKPHYVISCDSDDVDIPQHLDCDSRGITLFASSVIDHDTVKKWQGDVWFLPYYSIGKELRKKVRGKLGRQLGSGGNSISSALFVVTLVLGVKICVFVGNELCLSGVKDYYADKESAKQEKLKNLFPVVDVAGEEKWTLPALFMYSMWIEKVCSDLTPPGFFIDSSVGLLGKSGSAINVRPIKDSITLIDKIFDRMKAGETIDELRVVKRYDGDESKVLRYDMQAHREELLQLARN
ncbi:6-hydroxymethylpterin diphosphokinase MptE-like protein [Neptuniibacter sp.]|uniref:6-hydroxymethylpterin diphosphokinase MptE-like protein n=1 Tax=Neptuniibacter sp. TaxID=1962643 RepID=UPI0026166026|nr:6-hydroxymethylpterin diphosphokinase MptE-like protein [Neptuniibacter sp.]MCP4597062.1 DUF115 domain-containing protein [Neptuniibacter sp.]